jgi:hypothetical protein
MPKMPPSHSQSPSVSHRKPDLHEGFLDIDTLRDAYGIIAVISKRMSNGTMTFAVFKEFERDGKVCRTSFIPELMGEQAESMVRKARMRIAEIREDEVRKAAVTTNLRQAPAAVARTN